MIFRAPPALGVELGVSVPLGDADGLGLGVGLAAWLDDGLCSGLLDAVFEVLCVHAVKASAATTKTTPHDRANIAAQCIA